MADVLSTGTEPRPDALTAAVDALRLLVEGRHHPGTMDRRDHFHQTAGAWGAWLTRDQHARLKAALEEIDSMRESGAT